jgi:hypothetical protein
MLDFRKGSLMNVFFLKRDGGRLIRKRFEVER